MMNEFLRCFVGKWSNKKQAMSNPTKYAWILTTNLPLGDGKYELKSWYHYQGPSEPYRQKIVTFAEFDDHIMSYSHNDDGTINEKCSMIIHLYNGVWKAHIHGDKCVVRGAILKSEFSLTRDSFVTRDGGFVDGKRIWGSKDFYHFGRIAQR